MSRRRHSKRHPHGASASVAPAAPSPERLPAFSSDLAREIADLAERLDDGSIAPGAPGFREPLARLLALAEAALADEASADAAVSAALRRGPGPAARLDELLRASAVSVPDESSALCLLPCLFLLSGPAAVPSGRALSFDEAAPLRAVASALSARSAELAPGVDCRVRALPCLCSPEQLPFGPAGERRLRDGLLAFERSGAPFPYLPPPLSDPATPAPGAPRFALRLLPVFASSELVAWIRGHSESDGSEPFPGLGDLCAAAFGADSVLSLALPLAPLGDALRESVRAFETARFVSEANLSLAAAERAGLFSETAFLWSVGAVSGDASGALDGADFVVFAAERPSGALDPSLPDGELAALLAPVRIGSASMPLRYALFESDLLHEAAAEFLDANLGIPFFGFVDDPAALCSPSGIWIDGYPNPLAKPPQRFASDLRAWLFPNP